jgi:hypothetical protein
MTHSYEPPALTDRIRAVAEPIPSAVRAAPSTSTTGVDPRFDSRAKAKAAGSGLDRSGEDPGHGRYLDRGTDGVACE